MRKRKNLLFYFYDILCLANNFPGLKRIRKRKGTSLVWHNKTPMALWQAQLASKQRPRTGRETGLKVTPHLGPSSTPLGSTGLVLARGPHQTGHHQPWQQSQQLHGRLSRSPLHQATGPQPNCPLPVLSPLPPIPISDFCSLFKT